MAQKLSKYYQYGMLILLFVCTIPILANAGGIDNSQVVENQYIIVLKEHQFSLATPKNAKGESVKQIAERLITEVRQNQILVDMQKGVYRSSNDEEKINKLGFVYETAIKGFSATLTEESAELLQYNPAVDYIEQDHVVSINAIQTPLPSWGLDRIDQRDLPLDDTYQYDTDGSIVHVYILDTGVRATHNEFEGRIGSGYDFIDNDSDPDDCHGHGTHVAGTASGINVGVAKNSTIHPVRVLDCRGSGFYSQIIAGVDWVTANHITPSIANMSLGGPASSSLDTAVNNAIRAGVSFVVAAGNDNSNACNTSPSRVLNAITVASSTILDQRSDFSNTGTCVDIFAPGSYIWSALPVNYGFKSGTSMAAPHVAGVAALYLESNMAASPAEVANAIIANSTLDKITDAGSGTPNRLLFSQPTDSPPPPQNLAWLVPVINLILF